MFIKRITFDDLESEFTMIHGDVAKSPSRPALLRKGH